MEENLILGLIVLIPLAFLIFVVVQGIRAAKKRAADGSSRENRGKAAHGAGEEESDRDILEQLAFYRQEYHHRQIPKEVYEMHEREIAAKLKERREKREAALGGSAADTAASSSSIKG